MRLVFGGGLWPIGQKVGFVELPLSEALRQYERWVEGWKFRPTFRDLGDRPIVDQLHELLPLEMPCRRRLLVDTRSGWTASATTSATAGSCRSCESGTGGARQRHRACGRRSQLRLNSS